jgi:DNA polymerase (family 10)
LPEALRTLAAYATLQGRSEDARVLGEAAEAVAAWPRSARLALLDRPDTIPPGVPQPGPGAVRALAAPAVVAALGELAAAGTEAALAQAASRLPVDLARLLAVPGVALADVVTVHRRYGAVTAADLAAAVMLAGRNPGDPEEAALAARIEAALPALRAGHPRLPLGRAVALVERVRAALRGEVPEIDAAVAAGSVRRFEPTVGDVEIIVPAEAPDRVLARAVAALRPDAILHAGPTVASLRLDRDVVTLRAAPFPALPFTLLHHTGTARHVRQLRERAAERGWTLGPGGFAAPSGSRVPRVESEEDLYRALDLPWIPPELREGEDEIEAAAEGRLPPLVERADIRGDLHVHTLWSDGRDSVEAVAWAARALGYEYVAITDHSPAAAASRVLTLDRLEQQKADVARARRRVPGIAILHGVEVDILPDGSLDLPDAVLAGLDIVLASLHDPAGHGPDRLLERYVRAMRHPHVHIVTHPANRLVGRDAGYALDYDALFAAAVETGTVLEIDGAPLHLDLDGHLARRAVEAGVLVSIDSDCHNVARLGQQMDLGIGTARRGRVEARHVLNTRPLAEVRAFLSRKRSARV